LRITIPFLTNERASRPRGRDVVAVDAGSTCEKACGTPVVVVTGGSRGIGLAIASRFARAGRRVAIVARDETRLAAASASLHSAASQVPIIIPCDVTDPAALQIIERQLGELDCYVDILVNNAGVGTGGKLELQDLSKIEQVIRVNIEALTRLTRLAIRGMLARQHGGIINVSSLGGLIPGPHEAVYYASKAYVNSFTRALANELSGRGIRISCVLPGPVTTDFHDELDPDKCALYRRLLKWDTPDRVADAIYRGYHSGHRIIVPGRVNAALYPLLELLPHALTVPVMKRLLDPAPQKIKSRPASATAISAAATAKAVDKR